MVQRQKNDWLNLISNCCVLTINHFIFADLVFKHCPYAPKLWLISLCSKVKGKCDVIKNVFPVITLIYVSNNADSTTWISSTVTTPAHELTQISISSFLATNPIETAFHSNINKQLISYMFPTIQNIVHVFAAWRYKKEVMMKTTVLEAYNFFGEYFATFLMSDSCDWRFYRNK